MLNFIRYLLFLHDLPLQHHIYMQKNAPAISRILYGQIALPLILSALFVAGNILLPRICHLFSLGGPTWLPIYFCTLIGSIVFGWRVGLITALVSPWLNCILFGMPAHNLVLLVTVKSVLISLCASLIKLRNSHILSILAIVVLSQLLCLSVDWCISGNIASAWHSVVISWPGLCLQLAGGYVALRSALKR